ncbi:PREDICTED: centrosomal protein of 83 kDa [Nanorana parkeri]|uniref:centrosomal protein of 83 kDa n=1 Tax=Nanorana parkeri TaxID=125878 RepID=UPI0008548A8E|nr:PREDICTED: centrosomal protein of 83 kDa [Nanorana parkeri]
MLTRTSPGNKMESSFPAVFPQTSETFTVPLTETELHKLLIDEKMRCEDHKSNYQTLKAEHTRLQADYIKSQNECKQFAAEIRSMHEKYKLLLEELRGELLEKTSEMEELKLQVLSPHKLELLKIQIQQEIEAPVRQHCQKLVEDTEKYRADYNKLRYETSILAAQLEQQKEEQTRVLAEQKIKYEAEISQLEKDKEELQNQIISVDPTRDSKRVETLLGEKVQLCQMIKDLKAEVTELRASRDHYGSQAENVQRSQKQLFAETQATIRSLEAEKQSLKLSQERLENELHMTTEQNDILNKKLLEVERKVHTLTSKIDKLKHSQSIEITNIKLESARAKNEAEKDKDKFQGQLEDLETENGILTATLERQKELLAEKERELIRKVQAAKEVGLQETATILAERMELENRLAELEKYKEDQDHQNNTEISQLKEKVHIAQLAEESVRKELQNLRSKLQQQVFYAEQIKKEVHDVADLKREMKDLQTQVASLSESENNLLRTNEKLRERVEHLQQENRSARSQAEKAQHDAEKELEGNRIEWLQEKHKLQENLSRLEDKYKELKDKLHRAAVAQKKRKNIHDNKCKKLQARVEILEAKKEELETEKSVLNRQNISQEEYVRLQRRLKDLQRRHNEFRTVILGPNIATSGFLHPASYLSSTLVPGAEFSVHSVQEEQHQKELSMLRKRLEELEIAQERQLEELAPPIERNKVETGGSGHRRRNTEEEEENSASG